MGFTQQRIMGKTFKEQGKMPGQKSKEKKLMAFTKEENKEH